MSYQPRKKSVSEQIDQRVGVTPRTDYRCAAHGCPNAGVIDDRGEDNRGKCFFHASAPFEDWNRITAQIRADQSMRNHGIVPTKPSKWVLEALEKFRGPRGLTSINGSAETRHYEAERT